MGTAATVVEEYDRGIFCPVVGSGDPIPGVAARGCETKPGTQVFLMGQLVQGFRVQWLETINGPARQKLAQFAFDGIGLRIQQPEHGCIVCGLDLVDVCRERNLAMAGRINFTMTSKVAAMTRGPKTKSCSLSMRS
jgi:hypothetical protein